MIKIGKRLVGDGQPAYIIGEVGSNHDGSIERAKEYIKALKEIGCDAVKFQSFTAKGLFNKAVNETVFKILDEVTFKREWHAELKKYADSLDIDFLSTPFDEEAADLLDSLGINAMKIASGDVTDIPLIRYIAKKNKPIIMATGMANLGEIEEALNAISEEGNREVILLQCVGLYPTEYKYSNIDAMVTMKNVFKLPVGYSDHSAGDVVPLGAVAKGACVIEKHVTFSRDEKGPDHFFAMTVAEFGEMIRKIRNLELALGDGRKRPNEVEEKEKTGARRCLVANRDIKQGSILETGMLDIVRPEKGIQPKYLDKVIGKTAKVDIKCGESIQWHMI